MKQILLLVLFFAFCEAKISSQIIANVNNEPITKYEFNEAIKKFGGDKKMALDSLINDKLIAYQIKILNIKAEPFEIENKIAQIAQQNNLSKEAFQNRVLKQISLGEFRNNIANVIKQEKLFGGIFQNSRPNITEEQAKKFYQQNSHYFTNFTKVDVVRFFSIYYETLENFAKQKIKSTQGIVISNENYNLSSLKPQIADILNKIPPKTLTPIFPTNGGYEMFVVVNKSGTKRKSFESVKEQIFMELAKNYREEEFKSYIDKIRSKAEIKFIN